MLQTQQNIQQHEVHKLKYYSNNNPKHWKQNNQKIELNYENQAAVAYHPSYTQHELDSIWQRLKLKEVFEM